MAEYINREDVLKCLEYNTIQKPSANDVVSATLRVAREKVEKLPVAQEGAVSYTHLTLPTNSRV